MTKLRATSLFLASTVILALGSHGWRIYTLFRDRQAHMPQSQQARAKNYYYFYTRVDNHTSAIWALPIVSHLRVDLYRINVTNHQFADGEVANDVYILERINKIGQRMNRCIAVGNNLLQAQQ